MSHVTLPFDLMDMIIDWYVYLESTSDDVERAQFAPRLKAMSLVSRSWLRPCQRVLFQRIRLGLPPDEEYEDDLQVPRFLFLLLHPHLARYVVALRIWTDNMPAETAELLRCMPAVIPNLEVLGVEVAHHDPPAEFMALVPATLRRFARLDSLELECMREAAIGPWQLYLKSVQLFDVDITAPPELLLPLIRAVVAPRADGAPHRVQQGTFEGCGDTSPSQLRELHGLLMQVQTWTQLDVVYDGVTLGVRPPGDTDLSLGAHPLLTKLVLYVTVRPGMVRLLHAVLKQAALPALRGLQIDIMFEPETWSDDAGSCVSVHIPLDGDEPRILSEALAGQLTAFTFSFASCDRRVITILNWTTFEQHFQLPSSCDVKYRCNDPADTLPTLQ